MLRLNLFHEQQEIQRAKDYDPIRLTIIGGILLMAMMLCWGGVIYFKAKPIRDNKEYQDTKKKGLDDKLKKMIKEAGGLTDLPKIQGQAQALHDHMANRTMFATQLDIFRDLIPTNCQMTALKTSRAVVEKEEKIPGKKVGDKQRPPTTVRKKLATLNIVFTVTTQGKDKVEVLQVRDELERLLHREPRFRDWVTQVPDAPGSSNCWNAVEIGLPITRDPEGGLPAVGIFEFTLPMNVRYQPKEPPKPPGRATKPSETEP